MPKPSEPSYSGQGFLLGNALVFVVMFVLFLGSIYSLSFLTLTNVWPAFIALVLFFLAFWIPQTILARSASTTEKASGSDAANS